MEKRIRLLLTVSLLMFSGLAMAQTVSGVVTDEDQVPLPGVNVIIAGKNTGTATDFDGRYEVNGANADDVLTFSYIGFETKKEPVQGRQEINVSLKIASEALDEVVIVGASVKKGDLTGAVVNVDEEVLEERPVTSINEALQGRASGVFIQNDPSPGGNASIRIRGNNSLQYGGNPIFVIDGIVMDGDFNLTNLNDVASINVLKDASATALYGSRGANGVVVVTTKKGKSGEGQISYKTWMGVQEFTNEDITLNANDIFDLRIDALVNSHVADDYFAANPNASRDQFINEELLGDNSNWFADYEKESYAQGKNYNWLEEVSRSAIQQNHALSFSGGGEKNSYYLSFGYIDQDGLIKGSSNKRYTGRINAEQQIKPWLKVGTNTSYTKSVYDEVDGSVFEDARGANPLLPIERYRDTLFLAWGNNWDINAENPINSLKIEKDRIRTKLASSNYAEAKPIEGLTIRTTFAVDNVKQEYYEYVPRDIQQAKRDSYLGRAIHNLDYSNYYQWDNSITYETDFGKHDLTALFSTSLSKDEFHYTNVLARDFPTDDFSYYDLGGAFDKPNFSLGSDKSAATLQSYLGRLNYNYDNRYFLTLTGRYDGSSRFYDGHKWGFFPSVAASWNITNEQFMESQHVFDLMKLRVGYGSVGNQNIPNYAFYSLYNPVYSNEQVSFVSSGLRGTPNLTWEKQDQFNLGIDLSLLNNRLSITAEYFDIVNSNLLMRRTLSTITGYSAAIENIGEMTNRGVELTINGVIIDNDNFHWDVSANFSKDKNKITKLYQDVDAIYNFGGFTGTDIQRTGNFFLEESLNSIYMWEFDRIIQPEDMDYVNGLELPGKTLQPGDILPKDQQEEGEEGYGVIDEDDRVIVGKQDPKFYGGFSTRFSWKNLSLNSVFTYSYGAKKISGYYEGLMSGTGFGPAHTDMLNRWTPTHMDTSIPRATYDNAQRFGAGDTSWGLQDASYLRLSTITLSYDLPGEFASKIGMSSLRLYVSGNNVLTWTDYKGYDPENGDWYPTARMLVTGLDVTF
ncbi:SusC/RagA family TonB-linked outer membrane protein [Galbibacter pacificus]|uniref:TonB-dependent receptor n=1 Tax=Galbibacter pacificus TaxID=2996052 RepID=A0ABT6FMS4_9FLAO|nr:TonB-dependent receptor [Galbibacter pacificus]MDG3581084.1 TonB-dependent receptor [Galbibacter pacificus]MDG3584562.1 TonB-dependent receptor [Galbibacter pacificus]